MWVRQCDLDAEADALPPIPARIASNEEFVPPPQSLEQKAYESRVYELADQEAPRQGLTRRHFFRTGSGMAAALMALNDVFGPCYEVSAAEVKEPGAFEEKWPKEQFIFDVQTHHIDISHKWYDDTPVGQATVRFFQMLRPSLKGVEASLEQLNRVHYVKEVFGDSDTTMAVISGVPTRDWDKNPLRPTRWWPPANMSTTWPGRAACCRMACSVPTSARKKWRRWSARSKNSRSMRGRCTPVPSWGKGLVYG